MAALMRKALTQTTLSVNGKHGIQFIRLGSCESFLFNILYKLSLFAYIQYSNFHDIYILNYQIGIRIGNLVHTLKPKLNELLLLRNMDCFFRTMNHILMMEWAMETTLSYLWSQMISVILLLIGTILI